MARASLTIASDLGKKEGCFASPFTWGNPRWTLVCVCQKRQKMICKKGLKSDKKIARSEDRSPDLSYELALPVRVCPLA
ncbi:unnamed protein product [Periconia digitata]|uniref:Uncharacterized protein n=1 Tax=Periconia digitata TaxID=1303443 RepID=A0A9W4ULH8_9PLEO|nr:unnamed protein product [Periconia digitata]